MPNGPIITSENRGRPAGSKSRTKKVTSTKASERKVSAQKEGEGVAQKDSVGLSLLSEQEVVQVDLEKIDLKDRSFQFRHALRVGKLVESIRLHGQQIPVLLRPCGDEKRGKGYQVISGFRRIAAIGELGGEKVAAIIREDLKDDQEAFKCSIIENEARKTYNDLDRGLAVVRYRALNYPFEDLETLFSVGKRQLMRLQSLTKFPKKLKDAIASGAIQTTHALVLQTMLVRHPDLDLDVWIARIKEEGMSIGKLRSGIQAALQDDEKLSLYALREEKGKDGEVKGRKVVFKLRSFVPEDIDEKGKAELRNQLSELMAMLG